MGILVNPAGIMFKPEIKSIMKSTVVKFKRWQGALNPRGLSLPLLGLARQAAPVDSNGKSIAVQQIADQYGSSIKVFFASNKTE